MKVLASKNASFSAVLYFPPRIFSLTLLGKRTWKWSHKIKFVKELSSICEKLSANLYHKTIASVILTKMGIKK